MKAKRDTVKVMGKEFLKCGKEDCEWNIGWLGGLDWIEEAGKGTRICNLGVRAMIEAKAKPPENCPQYSAVLELARGEFEL